MKILAPIFLFFLLVSCAGEIPQQPPKEPDPDSLLINGTPATDDDVFLWPVVKIQTGNAGCSATIVGKRVLLTASHCATTGSTSRFQISYGEHKGLRFTAQMSRSPYYLPGPAGYDVALGYLDKEYPGLPASVNLTRLEKGDAVVLSGYGCTSPGGGGTDGRLRYGDNIVDGRNQYDTITYISGKPSAAACYGDSGSSLWKIIDNVFRVVGVVSKGNIKNTSYLARLDVDQTKSFFESWTQKYDAKICGFNESADLCGEVKPPQPEVILQENPYFKVRIEVKDANPHDTKVVGNMYLMLLDFLEKSDPLSSTPPSFVLRQVND